jgi:NTE family protein
VRRAPHPRRWCARCVSGLADANLHPDCIAGFSIGAINGALVAGNGPEARVYGKRVTANPFCDW